MINNNENTILNEVSISSNKPPYIIQTEFQVNKLIKTLEYNYEIEISDAPGNWPIVVIPRSGTFVSDSKSKNIATTVIFCPNTGVCHENNPDVLPFNLDYSCGFQNNSLLFTDLRLKANEAGTSDYVYSTIKHIECVDCITNIMVELSGNTTLDDSTGNMAPVNIYLSNLTPGQTYSWSFSKTLSNWPATVSPNSGAFIAPADNYTLESLVTFCKDISCSGSHGYAGFTRDHLSDIYKYIGLNFTVNSNDHCYFDDSNHNITIACKNCIPYPQISFNNPLLLFNSHCSDLEVSISGLDTNQAYEYYFSAHAANWPVTITPISGSFVTTNNTNATIPFKVAFCGSEILCSGDPNLLSYSVNYDRLYSETECEKYAYIKYNLVKSDTFSVLSSYDAETTPNPLIQSDIVKLSCDKCLGSNSSQSPNVALSISTGIPPIDPPQSVPSGQPSGILL
jgi:hypothetical protein